MRDKEGIPRISGQDSERQVRADRRPLREPCPTNETGVIMTATGAKVFGSRVFLDRNKDKVKYTTKSLILAQDER